MDERHTAADGVTDEDVDAVAEAVRDAETTVALTGAGVSTASGIPSFRGENGVWDRYDTTDFHRRRFDADPSGFWRDRVTLREELYGADPEPNAAHEALADLGSTGHVDAVVTQNVDGLHGEAGSERVVELHGTNRRVVCDDCGERVAAGPVFECAAEGSVPPRCQCGGVYKPDVVLFGESLSDAAVDRAQRLARESDAFLALGSSLSVRPAALLPRLAGESGATLVVVNFEPTPRDCDADRVLRADVTELLPAVTARLSGR